jgi:hypothetical protein
MSDWDWGYERGLWEADGIPHGLFEKETRYVRPKKIENAHCDKTKELLLIREKIRTLKKEENKIKEELKSVIPPFCFLEVSYEKEGGHQQYILQRKCHKNPQRLKSLMHTENYIRQTYGHKITQDILANCTKQSKSIDTIYIFQKKIEDNFDWLVTYDDLF